MVSFLLPKPINLSVTPGFLKREGPNGSFLKTTSELQFHIVPTTEGILLFIEGTSPQEEATSLSHLYQLAIGLSRGFRRRVRLVGIGFRAVNRKTDVASYFQAKKTCFNLSTSKETHAFFTKNYRSKRRKERQVKDTTEGLILKVGFSHEFAYPLDAVPSAELKVSRTEGRSKGTIVSIQGKDLSYVNNIASEIRTFRSPDSYKGKGIHYDREVLTLKKGKRQS